MSPSSSTPVTENKDNAKTDQKADTIAEFRNAIARLDARTTALHRDLNALSLFVRNTQAMHTELMSRLCDQVFRISDILNLLPVAQANANPSDDEDNDNVIEEDDDDKEEEGGIPPEEAYQRDQIL
jgi:predicted trehalose synthase